MGRSGSAGKAAESGECHSRLSFVTGAVPDGDGPPVASARGVSHIGLSVDSYYAGGFLHADDIRTLAGL